MTLRWRRDGVDVPGASAPDYVPVAADDGTELRCVVTATNASGSASAVTEAVRIVHAAPVATGALGDRVLDQGQGAVTLDASAAFTGAALTFGVTGGGATIDPATGILSLAADTPRAGETVTVTATNSGGSASVSFTVTVIAAPVLTAPASLVAPSLSGTGRVGAPMRVETGTWSGDPTPVLSVRWTRNGADIPGATGVDYVPVAADEGTELRGVVTATNAAGGVTVATAPVFIATPGTLRAQVEALATSAGRTSTAALKAPGVDALPSGVTLSGKTITLSGAGATLENWNLTGLLVQMNGADQTVRQCVLGEADGVAGILYYVQTGPDATNPTVENCDLFGFEGVGGSGAFVNQQTSGGEVTPNVARGLTLRLNHFRHASGDYIKVHGADFRIERNFFDVVSCYPPGTPTWNPDIVFAVGDPCLNASGFLFLARQAGTLPEPPSRKTDDAFWDSQDPHTDLITVRGAVGDGDHLILNNYFISQVGARSPGLTQQIRYVRNTGTPTPSNRLRIIGNVFEEWGGFYPFAAGGIRDHVVRKTYDIGEYCSAGGLRYRSLQNGNAGNAPESSPAWWEQVYDTAFDGPVVFQHNWLGKGSNGAYYANGAMSDTLTLWGDNLDHLTDVPVTAPEYATVTTTPQPAFGSTGPAPSLAEYGPFTGFDIMPLTYGRIQAGGIPVNACVVAVHGQVAVFFPQDGSPVVLSGRGFTLSEQGGGTWRLSTTAGAAGVKAVVSAGSATVRAAGSSASTIVTGGVRAGAPTNTVEPAISGAATAGATLSATDGTWTGDAPITYARQWRRDDEPIPGATGATYVTVPADVGKSVSMTVTASNAAGSGVAASAVVGPVVNPSAASPFFTVRPAGPYHVDPANVPANTTRIEYSAVIRLGAHPSTAGVVTLAAQESTGCDIQIGFSAGGAVWRCVVEDGSGGKMISGASSFSAVPAPGTWFKLGFDADFGTGQARILVNDVVVDAIPFIATAAPATFQTSRAISFFATYSGNSGTATGGVGTVDCEYIEAYFTTGGTRTLRKRIDASNVNSDPWKRGADA